MKLVICSALLLLLLFPTAQGEKTAWRQATDAELASLLPTRAPVEKEHIETEMRTASGIVNSQGRYIAGVVLITAGYSADGKYSHYLVVQAPIRIGGVALKPGEYVFGYTHAGDLLSVHFNEAATARPSGLFPGDDPAKRWPKSSEYILDAWGPSRPAATEIPEAPPERL